MQYFSLKHYIKIAVLGPCCSLFIWPSEEYYWAFCRGFNPIWINKEMKFNFNDFLWQAIFGTFQTWEQIILVYTKYPSTFSCLKLLQSNNTSFRTIAKPLSNKTREIFCEGFKWMCKLFDVNEQKGFKNFCFS